ncbi:hypothetical protein KM043_007354 [Ampulex compressa]|nr:hypothetical protein KM043_007354 [Ampulex compressa]
MAEGPYRISRDERRALDASGESGAGGNIWPARVRSGVSFRSSVNKGRTETMARHGFVGKGKFDRAHSSSFALPSRKMTASRGTMVSHCIADVKQIAHTSEGRIAATSLAICTFEEAAAQLPEGGTSSSSVASGRREGGKGATRPHPRRSREILANLLLAPVPYFERLLLGRKIGRATNLPPRHPEI